ncbi:hypothetical protein ABZ400_02650 [Streptomyces sp. NPDC005897]|uniref:hypothetical protein n=1 Tax=Streptomyces sp. NPDC005897 TaxID=3157081 RepID=UPI0033E837ED
MKRRAVLMGLVATAVAPTITACSAGSGEESAAPANAAKLAASSGHITGATAITEVFGNGQRLTAVAVEYDTTIDRSSLSLSSFKVADRTVTNVYANTKPQKAGHGTDGAYVIIELSPADEAAAVYTDAFSGGSSPSAPSDRSASPSASPSSSASASSGTQSGPPKGRDLSSGSTLKDAVAAVTQTASLSTTGGKTYATSGTAVKTSKVVNLIVDDFRQLSYTDSTTGNSLK